MSFVLNRPSLSDIGIDARWTNSPEGWPTEVVKCGSPYSLTVLLSYYLVRRKYPQLVPKSMRAPIDIEFCDVFLKCFEHFTNIVEIGDVLLTLLSEGMSDRSLFNVLQVMETFIFWLDPDCDYFLFLNSIQRGHLLSYAFKVLEILYSARGEMPLNPLESSCLPTLILRVHEARLLHDALSEPFALMHPSRYTSRCIRSFLNQGSVRYADPMREYEISPSLLSTPLSLWSVSLEELAIQWTIGDHELFQNIPLVEFLSAGWDASRFEHSSDAVRAYIDRFNATALFFSSEILTISSPQERAALISQMIKLLAPLERLNNFCSISAICMALRRPCISRLKSTWEIVPPLLIEKLAHFNELVQDKEQYRVYKDALRVVPASVPAVPLLGAHTMEVTASEMNLPPEIEPYRGGDPLPSVKRYRSLLGLVSSLLDLQTRSYVESGLKRNSPLLQLIQTTLRPFYFAFETDREVAVDALDVRSTLLESASLEEEVVDPNSTWNNSKNPPTSPKRLKFLSSIF